MPIANPIPDRLARVVDADVLRLVRLGRPTAEDVFVTAAEDLAGYDTPDALAARLGIREQPAFYLSTFRISEIKGHVASPVFREESQCFVGAGRPRGGAREFIIRNQLLPQNATVEIVA